MQTESRPAPAPKNLSSPRRQRRSLQRRAGKFREIAALVGCARREWSATAILLRREVGGKVSPVRTLPGVRSPRWRQVLVQRAFQVPGEKLQACSPREGLVWIQAWISPHVCGGNY